MKRYVVVSTLTGRVQWHADPGMLRLQVEDAEGLERSRQHLEQIALEHGGEGPFELKAVGRSEFRTMLLQAAIGLLHGSERMAFQRSEAN